MTSDHDIAITEAVYARDLAVKVYIVPTSAPESDGTIEWQSTTMILVTVRAGDQEGLGYTYAAPSCADVVWSMLKPHIVGENVLDIPALHAKMVQAIRNQGTCGIAMMAVSAVDTALWDLKARLFGVPICNLLGRVKDSMLIYGSGGFTSYNAGELQKQLGGWAADGIGHVKMKIGRDPVSDVQRVSLAREAIGPKVKLFVDANGAYTVKQAIAKARDFGPYYVSWFEEPVVAYDHAGLRFIREHVQPEVNIAGGEYGYTLSYFKSMLEDHTVDVLQADATRCGGVTGFLKAGFLAEAYALPFSSHCAPMLHLAVALALPSFYIAEYFYDHVRIESMFFDGFITPRNGYMQPDLIRPGLGVEFKYEDAAKYQQ